MSRKLPNEKGWALFLDRDGVLNRRIQDDYVKHPDEFELIPGVTEAMKILASLFDPIIVVTNQQGIGRGFMTHEQLELIHKKLHNVVLDSGGRIDAVFYSPDLKNTRSFSRKPSVGMGLKAKKQFPAIIFKQSIMAGDSFSDILFGHRLGMITVLIGSDRNALIKSADILDFAFPDLISFAEFAKVNFQLK